MIEKCDTQKLHHRVPAAFKHLDVLWNKQKEMSANTDS